MQLSTLTLLFLFFTIGFTLLLRHRFLRKLHQQAELIERMTLELQTQKHNHKSKDLLLLPHTRLRSLEQVFQNVVQQWRSALSIISNVGMKMRSGRERDELSIGYVKESVDIIDRTVLDLSRSLSELTVFFQPNKSKIFLDLDYTFNMATDMLQKQIKEANIVFELKRTTVQLRTYQSELMHIFLHLLDSSIEAFKTQKNTQNYIFVNTVSDPENLTIHFYDNAGSISKRALSKVLSLDGKKKIDHISMGLFISKELMQDKLEGQLEVSDYAFEHQGEAQTGVMFTLVIPIKE